MSLLFTLKLLENRLAHLDVFIIDMHLTHLNFVFSHCVSLQKEATCYNNVIGNDVIQE